MRAAVAGALRRGVGRVRAAAGRLSIPGGPLSHPAVAAGPLQPLLLPVSCHPHPALTPSPNPYSLPCNSILQSDPFFAAAADGAARPWRDGAVHPGGLPQAGLDSGRLPQGALVDGWLCLLLGAWEGACLVRALAACRPPLAAVLEPCHSSPSPQRAKQPFRSKPAPHPSPLFQGPSPSLPPAPRRTASWTSGGCGSWPTSSSPTRRRRGGAAAAAARVRRIAAALASRFACPREASGRGAALAGVSTGRPGAGAPGAGRLPASWPASHALPPFAAPALQAQ